MNENQGKHQEEHYKGFLYSWVEPSLPGVGIQMNIGSETASLHELLDASETERPNFQTLEEAKEDAQRAIDTALARAGR
jgi:hypothetical protein